MDLAFDSRSLGPGNIVLHDAGDQHGRIRDGIGPHTDVWGGGKLENL